MSRSRRSWQLGMAVLAMACAAHVQAASRVLVIAGLGGDPQYNERFTEWSQTVARASATVTGDAAKVQHLHGNAARREEVEKALREAAQELRAGDQFVLVLLGHGTWDGEEYRYNLPGPDITGTQIGALLDRIPEGVSQLVVNATSTSGAVIERWAKPGRVIITATRSGGERNATRFGAFWADALVNEEADLDKDGNITAQEAYDFAVRRVADAFRSDAAVLTERARIEGNEPSRFVVARLGAAAMFASDPQLIAMRTEQDGIEQRVGELRLQKAQLGEDDYYDRLESVLVELARVGARVDARLAVLGVSEEGGADAQR